MSGCVCDFLQQQITCGHGEGSQLILPEVGFDRKLGQDSWASRVAEGMRSEEEIKKRGTERWGLSEGKGH